MAKRLMMIGTYPALLGHIGVHDAAGGSLRFRLVGAVEEALREDEHQALSTAARRPSTSFSLSAGDRR